MQDDRNDDLAYQRAHKRVEDLRGFYAHVAVYLAVNLGLFIINRVATPRVNWFIWPLVGWGVAVLIHAISVFILEGPRSERWAERKTRQLMQRERSRWRPQPPQPRAP